MLRRIARRLKRAFLTLVAPHRLPAPLPIYVEVPPQSPPPPPLVEAVEPVFASFKEASDACGQDYEEPGLVEFLSARNKGATFDLSTLPTPAILATFDALRRVAGSGDQPIRVLDLGGAFGAHLKWAEQHLPFRFKWAVVETPALVALAEPSENLAFFSNIGAADDWLGGIDLLLASGVLQYFNRPIAMLKSFTGLRPKAIVISRTIVSFGKPVFEIQKSRLFDNGPGTIPSGFDDREVRMVHAYHSEQEILSMMTNHELVYKLYEGPPRVLNGETVRDGAIYLFRLF